MRLYQIPFLTKRCSRFYVKLFNNVSIIFSNIVIRLFQHDIFKILKSNYQSISKGETEHTIAVSLRVNFPYAISVRLNWQNENGRILCTTFCTNSMNNNIVRSIYFPLLYILLFLYNSKMRIIFQRLSTINSYEFHKTQSVSQFINQ